MTRKEYWKRVKTIHLLISMNIFENVTYYMFALMPSEIETKKKQRTTKYKGQNEVHLKAMNVN